jgi:hypothetical protein
MEIRMKHILIFGVFLLVLGCTMPILNASSVNRMEVAEGTVLKVSYVAGYYGAPDYYDTKVEFLTSEGQSVQFRDSNDETNVGDKVKVVYNPSKPSEARIYRYQLFWGWWPPVVFVGAVLFILGLWGWLSELKSQKKVPTSSSS